MTNSVNVSQKDRIPKRSNSQVRSARSLKLRSRRGDRRNEKQDLLQGIEISGGIQKRGYNGYEL